MGFQGVCRAIYDYAPQAEGELTITEGDLLYMLDTNSDDGWWKAKKKANTDDGDEPVGLVPNNYVEEVMASPPQHGELTTSPVADTTVLGRTGSQSSRVV